MRRAERGESVAVIAHGDHVADVVPSGELDRLRETIEVLSDAELVRELRDQRYEELLSVRKGENRVRLMRGAVSAGVLQTDKFGEEVRCGVGRVAEVNGPAGQIIAEVAALGERFGSANEGVSNQSAGAQVARQGRHDGGGHPGGP